MDLLRTKDSTELQIFENFRIDRKLPKYKVHENATGIKPAVDGTGFLPSDSSIERWQDFSFTVGPSGNSINSWVQSPAKQSWWDKFVNGVKTVMKPAHTYDVEEFFKSIKNSTTELKRVDERIDSFKAIMEHAKTFGQTVLVEKIQDELSVIKAETQLYAIELTTVILEEQVLKFAKDSPRALQLDWIENFTRVIPEKILATKAKADELKIFDNYVILHYDPNKKNVELTKKQKRDGKDPILFGVINNSRKLYYVGDWIDEYCDLTLEAFVDKFGKEGVKANDITATVKGSVKS